ncbi:hypothetical protein Dimus_006506 [Dionaea muscipula]
MGARPHEDSASCSPELGIAHLTEAELGLSLMLVLDGYGGHAELSVGLPSFAHPLLHSMLLFRLIVMMSSATAYSQQGAEIGGLMKGGARPPFMVLEFGIGVILMLSNGEGSAMGGDEGCLPRELGEGDALCVSGRGVNPYASKEGATFRGIVGVPPSYPLAARLEGRSPKKFRIKLKSRSLGESSQSRPETTTLCVVDAAGTLGPLPGRGEVVPSEPLNNESPLKSSMRPAECMTKGRRLQLPSGAFANRGRGRRGAGGRGRPDSPDRARVSTRDPEDRDRRSSRDTEDRPPKPPSAELTRGKGVASDYPRESQKDARPLVPLISRIPLEVGSQLSLWEARLVVLARP